MSGRIPVRQGPVFASATLVAVLLLVGCGTTVDEEPAVASIVESDSSGSVEPAEFDEDSDVESDGEVLARVDPAAGSAAELLPEIGIDMSRLSAEISGDGDEDATIARIEQRWSAIRGEVETDRPDLLSGLDATVAMARTAVDANRPADADKAFSILNDLVDAFTGDG